MGLFTTDQPLRPEIERVMLGLDKVSRVEGAKAQDALLGGLQPGEKLQLVAVDHGTWKYAVAVTDRRILVVRKSRVMGVFDRSRLVKTRLVRNRQTGTVGGIIEVNGDLGPNFGGMDNIPIFLESGDDANKLVVTIDRTLIDEHEPRDIPTLFPEYFARILAETGVPPTESNLARLSQHVSAGFMAAGPMTFFQQVNDTSARQDFLVRFSGDGMKERRSNAMDDMVDWLWDWNPACHSEVRRLVQRAEEIYTWPDSFLRTCNGVVPPLDVN